MTDTTATTTHAAPDAGDTDALSAAYSERAKLLALHTLNYPAQIGPAVDLPDDPEWRILYLKVADRWWTWHISPRDVPLFAHVHQVDAGDAGNLYDGHSTAEKYEALDAHVRERAGRSEAQILRDVALNMARDVVRDLENLDVTRYDDRTDEQAIRAGCVAVAASQSLLGSVSVRARYETLDPSPFAEFNRKAGAQLLRTANRHAAAMLCDHDHAGEHAAPAGGGTDA